VTFSTVTPLSDSSASSSFSFASVVLVNASEMEQAIRYAESVVNFII